MKSSFKSTVAALAVLSVSMASASAADVVSQETGNTDVLTNAGIPAMPKSEQKLVRMFAAIDYAAQGDVQTVLLDKAQDLGIDLELKEVGSIVTLFGQGRMKSSLDLINESGIIPFVTQTGADRVITAAYDETINQLSLMLDTTVKTAFDRYVDTGVFDIELLSPSTIVSFDQGWDTSKLSSDTIAGTGEHTAPRTTNGHSQVSPPATGQTARSDQALAAAE